MRLDTRSRYAIIAIVDMVLHADKGPVTLASLAKKQDISISYLEQIFAKLKKAKIVKSVRGPGGGYVVGDNIENLSLAAILRALDPDLGRKQDAYSQDQVQKFWDALHNHVADFFEKVTLHEVVEGKVAI
ncbi:MAG: Rrf2 family transcriptional regulator [Alphaproteobacteria bacterium]|nr:Rrf2 family transcriptional regulator [Alphaproteobacteria bacterium]